MLLFLAVIRNQSTIDLEPYYSAQWILKVNEPRKRYTLYNLSYVSAFVHLCQNSGDAYYTFSGTKSAKHAPRNTNNNKHMSEVKKIN